MVIIFSIKTLIKGFSNSRDAAIVAQFFENPNSIEYMLLDELKSRDTFLLKSATELDKSLLLSIYYSILIYNKH